MEMAHIMKVIGTKGDNMVKESLEIKAVKYTKEDMSMDN